MKLHSALLLALSFLCGVQARAQAPIANPFPAVIAENFDSHVAGVSPGFLGFPPVNGGPPVGQFTALQGGLQHLVINNRNNVLPPLGVPDPVTGTGPNNLYGNGNDVRILFDDSLTRFGGQFSQTNIAVNVTAVTMTFFLNGVQVGSPQTVTLPPTPGGPGTSAYIFIGFDTGVVGLGPFNEVHIVGNGSRRGYVGMDSLIGA